MRVIILTQGQHTVVDDDVYAWASKYNWYARKSRGTFYAARGPWVSGKQIHVSLHREIMRAPKWFLVDRRDGDGLNNVVTNLRLCSNRQNTKNQSKAVNNTSGFKGVTWDNRTGRYQARIMVNWRSISLGNYDMAIEAALAYDRAAPRYHGEFARLNFPNRD